MNVKKIIFAWAIIPFFVMSQAHLSHAQTSKKGRYVVYLKDKPNWQLTATNPKAFLSQGALLRRTKQGIGIGWRDVPVYDEYIRQLKQTGAGIKNVSRWFNAVQVESDSQKIVEIQKLSFVAGPIEPISLGSKNIPIPSKYRTRPDARAALAMPPFPPPPIPDFGQSLLQMKTLGIDSMHAAGHNGAGMIIAVLDAGFYKANEHITLAHLYENKQILGTYDFVTNDSSVYEDNYHGMAVLSNIAAYKPSMMVAGAYKSSYYLFRTEDAASESPTECFNWAVAAEKADSLGVHIIQSSLGYSRFDKPQYNISVSQLNGRSTFISKAASYCAATGMAVVVSAGNEGNDISWQRSITAPADADSVLAVGAIRGDSLPASFSSRGPSADGRIKPDVVAMGANVVIASPASGSQITTGSGTSYAAPMICGLVAGLWGQHPDLSAQQLIHYIRLCSHKSARPDNQNGYGIPSFQAFNRLLKEEKSTDKYSVYPTLIANQEVFLSVPFADLGKAVKLTLYTLPEPKKIATITINQAQSRNILKFDWARLKPGSYVIVMENGKNQSRFSIIKH